MKKNIQEGTSLGVNAGIAQKYATKLRTMTRAFTRLMLNKITKIYKEHKTDIVVKPNIAQDKSIGNALFGFLNKEQYYFSIYFSNATKQYASNMIENVDRNSRYQLNNSLKSIFKNEQNISTSPVPKGMYNTISKMVETNVALVRNVPLRFFSKIHESIMSCLLNGAPVSKLRRDIIEIGQKEERAAELIALDQTRKAYMNINLIRMKDAGISKFKWVHTGGGLSPRHYHRDVLNGQIFDLDKPPRIIDNSNETTGYPGQLPNCKCVMVPVVDLNSKEKS